METKERRTVHIINPVSGSGRKFRKTRKALTDLREDIYLTKRESDCEDFIAEFLTKDPYAHVVAHGGDGTMSEAVTGIMKAHAGATALFTGVPAGNGNDFLRYMKEEKDEIGKEYSLDLIEVNGRYSVNIINVGFDCTVVAEAEKVRKVPGIGNSFSYILGVVGAVMKKEAFETKIVMRGVSSGAGETDETISGSYLLAAVANCRYYGGGFKAAPFAECDDGLIDLVLIKDVSVPRFAKLVSDFRKGCHVDKNGVIANKFKDVMTFRRCRSVSLGGLERICCDGEIFPGKEMTATVVPRAVVYAPPRREWLI